METGRFGIWKANAREDDDMMSKERIRKDLETIKKEIAEYLVGGASPSLSTTLHQETYSSLGQNMNKDAYYAVRSAYVAVQELDELMGITAVSPQDFEYIIELVQKALDAIS